MPMWRCPHCGTPQHEAARCWVCRRSSTTCSTCRHFRQSLAATVGYCGLDPRRAPLTGRELRGCWTGRSDAAAPSEAIVPAGAEPETVPLAVARLRPASRPGILEGFVPLELADRGPRVLQATERSNRPAVPPDPPAEAPSPAVIESVESWADRDSLFGDVDR
jgi:hypothetical protein